MRLIPQPPAFEDRRKTRARSYSESGDDNEDDTMFANMLLVLAPHDAELFEILSTGTVVLKALTAALRRFSGSQPSKRSTLHLCR